MNSYYYRAIIEDLKNHRCATQEIICLINVFVCAVQSLALTVVREAYYNVEDFHNAKANYVDKFTLQVKRKKVKDKERWHGTFKDRSKKLKIVATAVDEW
jgi:hypothetical protein